MVTVMHSSPVVERSPSSTTACRMTSRIPLSWTLLEALVLSMTSPAGWTRHPRALIEVARKLTGALHEVAAFWFMVTVSPSPKKVMRPVKGA